MTPRQIKILKKLDVDIEKFIEEDRNNWEKSTHSPIQLWGTGYYYTGPTIRTANDKIISKLLELGIGSSTNRGLRSPWRTESLS